METFIKAKSSSKKSKKLMNMLLKLEVLMSVDTLTTI